LRDENFSQEGRIRQVGLVKREKRLRASGLIAIEYVAKLNVDFILEFPVIRILARCVFQSMRNDLWRKWDERRSRIAASSGMFRCFFSLGRIEVQATQVEKDVGFESFFVPIAKRLFDQPLDFVV
jgi:hypothetical protein